MGKRDKKKKKQKGNEGPTKEKTKTYTITELWWICPDNHKDIIKEYSRMQVSDPKIIPSEPDELSELIDKYLDEYLDPIAFNEVLLQNVPSFMELSADEILEQWMDEVKQFQVWNSTLL